MASTVSVVEVEQNGTGVAAAEGYRRQRTIGIESLVQRWRAALDAADEALRAARFDFSPGEQHARATRLREERTSTSHLLESFARERGQGDRFVSLLVPWEARKLLGLPTGVTACVFDLEGVLIESATLHAAAWRETFDQHIWARTERTGGQFAPFNPTTDYPRYMHRRTRLEGVRAFLARRGISLPEGSADDPPGTETVHGLANQKNAVLLRLLAEQGVSAYHDTLRYLETARSVGVHSAVVSASANTTAILARAGLTGLIDENVDANTIVAEGLRELPEPDTLMAACEQLGTYPRHAAAFETSAAGVRAACSVGFAFVVGVDRTGHAEALRVAGADVVISGLGDLLDPRRRE